MGSYQFPPSSAGGDQTSFNRGYTTSLAGQIPIDVKPGVYTITAQSSANIIMGNTTILASSSGTTGNYFVLTQQNSMTIPPQGASGTIPWSGRYSFGRMETFDVYVSSVFYGNDLYLVGMGGRSEATHLYASTTGVGNWQQVLTTTNGYPRTGYYHDNKYIYPVSGGSAGGEIWVSTNAFHWERPVSGNLNMNFYEKFLNTFYIAGSGGQIRTSTDGINFGPNIDAAFRGRIVYAMAYGNGKYVLCGQEGQLSVSTNGTTWVEKNSNATGAWLEAAAYGNGAFVVAGGGQMRRSVDGGENWQIVSYGSGNGINHMRFINGLFIAFAYSTIVTSADGVTWTLRNRPPHPSSGNDVRHYDFRLLNGVYYMGGDEYRANEGRWYPFLYTTTTLGGSSSGLSTVIFEKKAEVSAIV
jgi:hypothetical protein